MDFIAQFICFLRFRQNLNFRQYFIFSSNFDELYIMNLTRKWNIGGKFKFWRKHKKQINWAHISKINNYWNISKDFFLLLLEPNDINKSCWKLNCKWNYCKNCPNRSTGHQVMVNNVEPVKKQNITMCWRAHIRSSYI